MDKQYTCGCGKTYRTYAGLSSHRKAKDNKENLQSNHSACHHKVNHTAAEFEAKQYFLGLNIIELGLIDLERRFEGKVIGGSQTETKPIMRDQKLGNREDVERFKIIINFCNSLTANMSDRAAVAVC